MNSSGKARATRIPTFTCMASGPLFRSRPMAKVPPANGFLVGGRLSGQSRSTLATPITSSPDKCRAKTACIAVGLARLAIAE